MQLINNLSKMGKKTIWADYFFNERKNGVLLKTSIVCVLTPAL